MKRLTVQQKRIVDRIKTLHRAGVPLNLSAVKRHHPKLLQQVMKLKHFRGWRKAVEAAGLSYDQLHVELLDHCVCALCGEELAALSAHVKAKHDRTKEEYCRKFPNEPTMSDKMRAEKTAALRRSPHWEPVWSREYLVDYAIYKHERGEDLSPWVVYRTEPAFHANMKKYFGSYRAGIKAAGIDYRKIRAISLTQRWTPAKVLDRIRELHRQRPLTSTGDIRRRDSRLYDRCHRYFGGVVSAVEAAGIPYILLTARQCHRWTKTSVLRTIQTLHNAGSSLRAASLRSQLNGQADALLAAAAQCFGSWNAAVRTAGHRTAQRRVAARCKAPRDARLRRAS